MHEATVSAEWLAHQLHDLCQPLTALQCRLVLATMPQAGQARGADMETAIQDALVQCERMMRAVRDMQEKLA